MNGCRENPVKNREFVPAASLRTGIVLGGLRGRQTNDTTWDERGPLMFDGRLLEFPPFRVGWGPLARFFAAVVARVPQSNSELANGSKHLGGAA